MAFNRVIALEGETLTFKLNESRDVKVVFTEVAATLNAYEMRFDNESDANDFLQWANDLSSEYKLESEAFELKSSDDRKDYLISIRVFVNLRLKAVESLAVAQDITEPRAQLNSAPFFESDYFGVVVAPGTSGPDEITRANPDLSLTVDQADDSHLEWEQLPIEKAIQDTSPLPEVKQDAVKITVPSPKAVDPALAALSDQELLDRLQTEFNAVLHLGLEAFDRSHALYQKVTAVLPEASLRDMAQRNPEQPIPVNVSVLASSMASVVGAPLSSIAIADKAVKTPTSFKNSV